MARQHWARGWHFENRCSPRPRASPGSTTSSSTCSMASPPTPTPSPWSARLARTPAVPVVRVPSNEPGIIGRALDAGALGVIVPLVNSADEARRAVAACRFPPDGTRSSGPLVPRVRHGQDYQAEVNDVVACIPMIETRQAVENVDEILAVPGIDAVYVGPNDLSLSYGLAPSVDNDGDPFNSALARVVESCDPSRRRSRRPRQLVVRREAPRCRVPDDHGRLRRRTGDRRPQRRRGGGASRGQSKRQRVTLAGNPLSDQAYTVAGRNDQNGRNDGSSSSV